MVEPMFKAPTPPPLSSEPKATENVAVQQSVDNTTQIETNQQSESDDAVLTPIEKARQMIEQYLWFVLGGCVLFGLLLGIMMGGDTVVAGPQGLMGVVENPAITEQDRLPRCGRTANETDPCVLYIMNSSRYEKQAQDFFVKVAELTKRQEYLLRIENQAYGMLPIKPGYFAQFKIPSLR